MHNLMTSRALWLLREQAAVKVEVPFVSPIFSAMFATSMLQDGCAQRLLFKSSAVASYASTNGLIDAINGNYTFPRPGGRQGETYTKLTRLANHDEVDVCNRVVNDLIFEQFE